MVLVLFTMLLASLLIVEFLVLDQDVIAPSFVITAVFLFSSLVVMLEHNNVYYKIGMQTTFTVLSGILVFFLTEVFISKLTRGKSNCDARAEKIKPIIISKWKIYMLVLFDVVILLATFYEVRRVATLGGYHTGSLINDYKLVSSFSTVLDYEERFNGILAQLTKISMVTAYVCVLLVLHNKILCGIKLKSMWRYLLPILLWIPMPILKGGRLDTIQFFVAFAVFFYVMYQIKCGWSMKMSLQFLWRIMKALPIFFIGFYGLKLIMGIGSEISLWKYIFQYTGANLVNLEAYLQSPITKSDIWGRETFYRIYNALSSLGLSNYRFTAHLEFRIIEKGIVDNCYTFFRRPLQDFGYIGMYVITIIMSFFYNIFYHKYIKGIMQRKYVKLLLYGFMFYPVILFSTDFYIGNVFTIGMVVTIVLFYLLYIWLTGRIKIHFRSR